MEARTSTDRVERVARRIFDSIQENAAADFARLGVPYKIGSFDETSAAIRDEYRRTARAAIEEADRGS